MAITDDLNPAAEPTADADTATEPGRATEPGTAAEPDTATEPGAATDTEASRWPSPLAIAACASIGAGGIHASIIGGHGDHRFLATLFVWVAAFQVVWGIAMLLRPNRELTALGLAGNAVIAAAWLVTRLTGLSFVDGLEVREDIQFADASAALLALVVVGITLGALLTPGTAEEHRLTNLALPAFLVAALALPAMVTAATHEHDEVPADSPGHGHSAAPAAPVVITPDAW